MKKVFSILFLAAIVAVFSLNLRILGASISIPYAAGAHIDIDIINAESDCEYGGNFSCTRITCSDVLQIVIN